MKSIFSVSQIIRRRLVLKENPMILGMTTFTFVHVALSLIGIFSGLRLCSGCSPRNGSTLDGAVLVTTVLTSVTGFFFPFHKFLPSLESHRVSYLCLPLPSLRATSANSAVPWRRTYAITAIIALYLNVFVLIAQLS